MTDKEIDKMEAGPEMDALIAEKVMGWRRLTYEEAYPDSNKGDHRLTPSWHDPNGKFNTVSGKGFMALAESIEDYESGEDPAWSPSTSISAAWEVVEKLHMTIYTPGSSYAGGEYQWRDDSDSESYAAETQDGERGHAETAPLAICRAALKSLAQR